MLFINVLTRSEEIQYFTYTVGCVFSISSNKSYFVCLQTFTGISFLYNTHVIIFFKRVIIFWSIIYMQIIMIKWTRKNIKK